MCSYLSKDKSKWSQAMKEFFKETVESGASYYEQMKSVAYSYASRRECSLQEAVYHVLPELCWERPCQGLWMLAVTFLRNVSEWYFKKRDY